MKLLTKDIKNKVLESMMQIIDRERNSIIKENKKDLNNFDPTDRAMYDRLIVDDAKVDSMIQSIREVLGQPDPVSQVISTENLENGLKIINKTAPFGTIMIIYESRPDVTIEAAMLAFKANNKILLKGGKEAVFSNKKLVSCWHEALKSNQLEPTDWIEMLELNREETQAFLKNPTQQLDLIVPRGGEKLIAFVKEHAKCAVLISGRGNNFVYVNDEADWEKTKKVILNAKTQKISACNALDKVLIDEKLADFDKKVVELKNILTKAEVQILGDQKIASLLETEQIKDESIWHKEFLALKVVIGSVPNKETAIEKINQYSGGHSACIMTENAETAMEFMEQVDSAAVYQNASTRFTDGGQMGVGAELAISTDKLHHRGPLGLKQLVTNKYYVFGNGQIR
ncbi:glutamate-5-semialdehyde dehydrogenase [Crocinitomix catalasitica]|uniref:glutamate-5-semialdehyde dehydrogenase n=1 Tax=Crocinitomix catalasitica TaxID=184607 RepID=UPI0004832F11|nr:glutamate-5-semialdehyde dehydrogenase [Crocinitomix catalasitica]